MLKIGVVDDHQIVRSSLSLLIDRFENFEVILQASNGQELIDKLKNTPIDIVLLDIQMPVMDGYSTATYLHAHFPELKILVLSQLDHWDSIHRILNCGAHGYLNKNSNPEQLRTAIQNTYYKGFYFDVEMESLFRQLVSNGKGMEEFKNPLSNLSERELIIIKLVAQGYSNVNIAEALFVNIRTIETYRKRITEKTGAKNFTNVIIMSIKFKYISVEDL